MLRHHINEANCQVPIKKLSGWPVRYLFGTRRIEARIKAGKPLIRAGGGWYEIDEFIEIYKDNEEQKKVESFVS